MIAHESATPFSTLFAYTLYSVCGSLLLAYLTYRLMIPLARLLERQPSRQFVLVIAVITQAIRATHALQLLILFFAITSKNLDHQYDLMELEFGVANELFIVMLFVSIGASIHLSDLSMVDASHAVLIAACFLAMVCGVFTFAHSTKIKWKQAALIMLGTLPMIEAGLGLTQTTAYLYPNTTTDVLPLLAGCLIVLELLEPIAMQFTLIKSGESGRE